ncbi:MAG: GntR family transcriptional regulator [Ramlibacter sp.]
MLTMTGTGATAVPLQLPGQSRYGGLASALRERILAGEWAPGEAIHAEAVLAQSYGVALGTMRQAIALLVEDGLLERRHGRGTFVSAGLSGGSMLRFFRFRTENDAGESPRSHILSRRLRKAEPAEAAAFGGPGGLQVLHLERLRSLGGAPCLSETMVLPLPLFGALADSDPHEWGDLLYPEFKNRCNVLIHHAEDHLSFGQMSATQARRLRLEPGHPCVIVRRQAYDRAGRCVELRTTRGDAHAFQYTAQVR